MFIQISGICQRHLCRRKGESSYAKTIRNHPFRHKTSAWQRGPSWKGLRKKTTRHVKANCGNPEKRSIRVRVQAQQARKTEIHGRKKRGKLLAFSKKRKKSTKMEIPPLSHTFRSTGFINPGAVWSEDKKMPMDKAFESLSIDIVEVEDLEAMSI